MDIYKEKLKKLEKMYLENKVHKEELLKRKTTLDTSIDAGLKRLDDLKEEKAIVLNASAAAREEGRLLIQNLATDTLRYSVNEDISVVLESSIKRSVPNIDVIIKNENGNISQPDLDAGGFSDLISLATFIATNTMIESNTAPIFLDEPTKFVSADHHEDVSAFINKIPEYANRQVFISTHDTYTPNTDNGKCFRMEKTGETTKVSEV